MTSYKAGPEQAAKDRPVQPRKTTIPSIRGSRDAVAPITWLMADTLCDEVIESTGYSMERVTYRTFLH